MFTIQPNHFRARGKSNSLEVVRTARLDMSNKVSPVRESFSAITPELLFAGMNRLVPFDGRLLREGLATDVATEGFFTLKVEREKLLGD